MADVNVKFVHPTDGKLIDVTLDDSITAQEAVAELITAEFIPASPHGYNLGIKGGAMLQFDQSFADANVQDNTTLRVIPATDAGYIK